MKPINSFRNIPIAELQVLERTKDSIAASLKYRGLGAEREGVPALKGIDSLVWHETNKRGLDVECFGRTPVEPHDRIE